MLAFFSYSHIDAESEGALIAEIHAQLEKKTRARWGSRSFEIWRDEQDLRWGEKWSKAIDDAIAKSDLFVLLLSPGWLRSSFCRMEFEAFKQREHAIDTGERILVAQILDIPEALLASDAGCRQLMDELGTRQRKMWMSLADRSRNGRMKLYREAADDLAELLFTIPTPTKSRELVAEEPLATDAASVAQPQAGHGQAVAVDTPFITIGSQLVGFAELTPELRTSIANSLLFAQLAANHADSEASGDAKDWVTKFVSVLVNTGWSVEGQSTTSVAVEPGREDARAQLQSVLLAMCPPAAQASVQALLGQALGSDDNGGASSEPLQLFRRHSRVIDGARFQIAHVTNPENQPVQLTLLAVKVSGQMDSTRVLFFKWQGLTRGRIDVQRFRLTLQPDVFDSVKDAVAQRVDSYAQEFMAAVDL